LTVPAVEWLFRLLLGIVVELFSLSWAYFEIQIEGDKSWARGLPCWRKKYPWFSKEITGYHTSLAGMIVSVCALMLAAIAIASMLVDIEIIIAIIKIFKLIIAVLLSISLLAVTHEDFLWNVLNPSPKFGVKNFTKKYPEVGSTIFIWVVPLEYVVMTAVSLMIAYLIGMLAIWLVIFATMLSITMILAARRYKKDIIKYGA